MSTMSSERTYGKATTMTTTYRQKTFRHDSPTCTSRDGRCACWPVGGVVQEPGTWNRATLRESEHYNLDRRQRAALRRAGKQRRGMARSTLQHRGELASARRRRRRDSKIAWYASRWPHLHAAAEAKWPRR